MPPTPALNDGLITVTLVLLNALRGARWSPHPRGDGGSSLSLSPALAGSEYHSAPNTEPPTIGPSETAAIAVLRYWRFSSRRSAPSHPCAGQAHASRKLSEHGGLQPLWMAHVQALSKRRFATSRGMARAGRCVSIPHMRQRP